ncbi:MAG: transcription antitermination factor NusB [Candidatus Sericytochromatia bacterium]|nr:transcription antitermination factor NusB [Candidatus Sericytochromatia bacterium]
MLNTRRVARELSLLTMAQISNRAEGGAVSIPEMLGRAADMLAAEARDRLQESGGELVAAEARVHAAYLEVGAGEGLSKGDLEELLGALDRAQRAVELLGSALEMPAQVALADGEEVRTFVLGQVQRYVDHAAEIDARLQDAAQNWSVDRMASLDRDVLRLAVGELLWASDTPVEVVINEAVELAKKYGTQDSGRFVNGVLARFAPEAARLRSGKPEHVV